MSNYEIFYTIAGVGTMTAINDPLLLQLQYVDQFYNEVFWLEQFRSYYHRAEALERKRAGRHDLELAREELMLRTLASAFMVCAERSLTNIVHYREQLEAQGAQIPTLPINTE